MTREYFNTLRIAFIETKKDGGNSFTVSITLLSILLKKYFSKYNLINYFI